jgi:hypothetical protein
VSGNQRPLWRINDVVARTDLADLLDQLAEPAMFATRGRRWHCPLPDHDDHHASVTIHTDHRGHQRWRCWSGDTNHRGDAIDLVSVTQRLDRVNALDWLAARNGMIPDVPLPPFARREPGVRPTVETPLNPCVMRYVEACEKILWRPTGRPVLDWLHGRGFDDDLLRVNRAGCDPGREVMQRQRGLAYGGSIAAVFPALSEQGDVHYVQTRYLNPGTGPKYDNPSSALATNPRIGWARVVDSAVPDTLAVCEGIPDALTAAALGYQSVATLGSQSSDQYVVDRIAAHALRNHLSVELVSDNDNAGRTWAQKLQAALSDVGLTSTVHEAPRSGCDLNDWFVRSRREQLLDGDPVVDIRSMLA